VPWRGPSTSSPRDRCAFPPRRRPFLVDARRDGPDADVEAEVEEGEDGREGANSVGGLDRAQVADDGGGVEEEGGRGYGEIHVGWPGLCLQRPGRARECAAGCGGDGAVCVSRREEFVQRHGYGDKHREGYYCG